MHVLYINKVSPRHGGGAEARIWEVGKRLIARGHQVTVVCSATEPGLPDEEILDGIRIHYLHPIPDRLLKWERLRFYGPRLPFYFLAAGLIRRVLGRGVDVLRDDVSPFPSFIAVHMARARGIPTIATVHNLSGEWGRWRANYGAVLGAAGYLGERWVRGSRKYDFIISTSRWMVEALSDNWPANLLRWIPNGVDTTAFHPREELASPSKSLNIFYAGRIVSLKAHATLIAAFSIALRRGLKATLHLAGDGPQIKAVRRQIFESDLSSRVVLHGMVEKSAMPELFRQMDIYVSPSRFEGLPITVLEAMASGLPIISTDIEAVGGLLERDYATLVPPDNPRLLAMAILKACKNTDLIDQMGKRGRRVVEEKFSWDSVVNEELAIMNRYVFREDYSRSRLDAPDSADRHPPPGR